MPDSPSSCPQCGSLLDPLRVGGACAACLLLGAADDTTDAASLGTLAGHELLEIIARGGMGIVYRARQGESAREVALKVLPGAALPSAEARQRFRIEAEAMARLEHPAILPIHGLGEDDGTPWFTMKLATGGTLAQRAASYAGKFRTIAELLIRIAGAVQFAHERGVLHRDLKPGNILFDETGAAFVSDFGLAKFLGDDADLTRTIAVIGTPNYLAPEIAAKNTAAATTASDTWSLGAMLYELLARRPPFLADSLPALLRKIAEESPAPLEKKVPGALRVITAKALAKDPARRYSSAAALAKDLRNWLTGEPITARAIGTAERAWLWAKRNPALAAVTSLSLLAVVAAFAALLWGLERSHQETKSVAAARDQIASARDEMAKARDESQQQLRDALLQRATSGRIAAISGWRDSGLQALRQAAAIRPGMDLRSEAIAHLAGLDMSLTIQRDRTRPGAPPGIQAGAGFSGDFDLFGSYGHTSEELVFSNATGNPVGSPVKVRFPARPDRRAYGVAGYLDPTKRRLALQRFAGGPVRHGDVVLIDVAGRTVLRQWTGADFGGFSQNGDLFAILFDKAEIGVFGATDGNEIGRIVATTGQTTHDRCALQPQTGSSLIAYAGNSTLEIWNWREKRLIGKRQMPNIVGHLAWSGDILASTSRFGLLQGDLWNVRSGQTRAFSSEASYTRGIYFTPDGLVLSAAGALGAGQGTHFDGISGQRILSSPLIDPAGYSADGRRFLSLNGQGHDLGALHRPEALTAWDTGSVTGAATYLDISPDGRWIILCGSVGGRAANTVLLLDAATRRVVAVSDLPVSGDLTFLADSTHLVCREFSRTLQAFKDDQWWIYRLELADGHLVLKRLRPLALGTTDSFNRVKVSPDRRWVALSSSRSAAIVEPLSDGPRRELEYLVQPGSDTGLLLSVSNNTAYWGKTGIALTEFGLNPKSRRTTAQVVPNDAVFSPDGRLAFSLIVNRLHILDPTDWSTLCKFPSDGRSANLSPTIAWSPDGQFVATVQDHSAVAIVDTVNKAIVARLVSPRRDGIQCIRYMPDGRSLVVLRHAGALEFWDLTKLTSELAAIGIPWDLPPPSVVPSPGIAGPVKPVDLEPLSSVRTP